MGNLDRLTVILPRYHVPYFLPPMDADEYLPLPPNPNLRYRTQCYLYASTTTS